MSLFRGRAGLVNRPEDYRWNSLGYHVQTNNRDNFLSTDFGLKQFNVKSEKERIRRYRRFVYEAASAASDTAPAILRIRASSDQRSLYLPITSGLNTYFIQNTKKSPNRSRAWMGYTR